MKQAQPLWKTARQFRIKPDPQLPYPPAIVLLGLGPEGTKTYIHTRTSPRTFSAALFLSAPNRKQLSHPTGERLNKLQDTPPRATTPRYRGTNDRDRQQFGMDLEGSTQREKSQALDLTSRVTAFT